MTTVVLWNSSSLISSSMKDGGINIIADSRVSDGSTVLTNNCAKIFEVPIHCQTTDDGITFTDREDHYDNLVVGIAGSTLIAHNLVFCLQQTLCRLVGKSVPSIDEIAIFTASVLKNLSNEVGIMRPESAFSEVVLVGNKGDKTISMSIKPNKTGPLEYNVSYIEEFPYAMGSGAKAFLSEYKRKIKLCTTENSLVQLPIRIFDEHLLQSQNDPHTGGELQMLCISEEGVSRFIPMRWNEDDDNYQRKFFGQDILNTAIGNAKIASSTFLLDDC